MSAKITTPYGHAVPPASRHSVTVHMPTWENVERYGADSRSVIATFQNAYPRMKPHRDIACLTSAILGHLDLDNQACLLFTSLQSAQECDDYSTSPRRNSGANKKPVAYHQIQIRAFRAKDRIYIVVFPSESLSVVSGFWSTPGVGVSSRFAEANLAFIGQLVEVELSEDSQSRSSLRRLRMTSYDRESSITLDERHCIRDSQLLPSTKDIYFLPMAWPRSTSRTPI
ncbi:uncharacterized protein Z518_05096 [Rhinocladiella mackenziei CBS 650.93]|uniref:Rhinocladiella mackenziei CBS 650.93 unplaced genomic scaffold supercont1.3, whole genome shotgun sequence n=1 Tax=Rhinocladiella mackenziei CBS 650.93 TaxID=1442369 RepID=A0A0D2IMV8_9EURO|nr:uncharacterized protein Z518_05096 [Rhinocladiella mackenziei CBS 650.93]KIX07119.1 hypothetical protein Z518_05096 [Rhinocladiella mackenziei CBS 650.93]